MTHAHVTTWFIAVILFFVSYSMQKSGKERPAKIMKMILRLFYILILATGAHLFGVWATRLGANIITSHVLIKAIFGLWVIFAMEFVLDRLAKGKPTGIFWAQFVISLLLAMIWGWVVI
ncbi:YisL family protein [Calidifontibacillus oryziterrae]|uniref:YisL family protein n=1 Tax=Calidifontibacillus oryziterrae TaxID=1191699 RepID=UPI0002E5B8A6|nr:YisL family protein [Calidifontibacillus oryziterrae]